MAINSVISRKCDLTKPLIREDLDHLLMTGDSNGDLFNIAVTHGSEPQFLTGGSVIGYFMRVDPEKKANEYETVILDGTSEGNVASILLPQSCYSKACRFVLTIKAGLDGRRHAIYVASGSVVTSTTDVVIDPGDFIPSIDDLLSAISALEQAVNDAKKVIIPAQEATNAANSAADKANKASTDATNAAEKAEQVNKNLGKWENVRVEVSMLPDTGTAKCTVTDDNTGKIFQFNIPRGYTGLTPTLTMGKVETGLPGTSVEATLTGTKENPILNLKIPRGDIGSIENFPYATNPPQPSSPKGSVGTVDRVAREDHSHPNPGGISISVDPEDGGLNLTYQPN